MLALAPCLLVSCLFASTTAAQRRPTGTRLVDPSPALIERSRTIEVELVDGLALVTTRVVLEQARHVPIEARVSIAVPPDAGLAGLRACSARVCRTGRPGAANAYEAGRTGRRRSRAPIATAARRGAAIEVLAAPIVRSHAFELTVRYVAAASTAGGVVRFEVPTQGPGSSARVTVRAPGLLDPRIDGDADASNHAVEASASLPLGAARRSAIVTRCGDAHCVRYRAAAGPVPPRPRDVFVLLDASPSVRGADPARREEALDALLSSLAPDSRVTRVRFARTADRLDPVPLAPRDVPRALALPSMGNQTLFERAWELVRDDVQRAGDALVVVVGDGYPAPTAEARAAFAELVASGAELSLIELEDRDVSSAMARAMEQSLGARVDDRGDLRERVAWLTAPVVDPAVRVGGEALGPLRAGAEQVLESVLEGGAIPTLRAFGRVSRARTARGAWSDGLAARSGVGDRRETLTAAALSHFVAARKHRAAAVGAGLSPRPRIFRPRIVRCSACGCAVRGSIGSTALRRLREQMRPRVRACFRDARAGRPHWQGRATLQIALRYGELVHASVSSSTDPALAACVAHAADALGDIPSADHTVVASFPFTSEPISSPAAEPLRDDVAGALDAIGLGPRAD